MTARQPRGKPKPGRKDAASSGARTWTGKVDDVADDWRAWYGVNIGAEHLVERAKAGDTSSAFQLLYSVGQHLALKLPLNPTIAAFFQEAIFKTLRLHFDHDDKAANSLATNLGLRRPSRGRGKYDAALRNERIVRLILQLRAKFSLPLDLHAEPNVFGVAAFVLAHFKMPLSEASVRKVWDARPK